MTKIFGLIVIFSYGLSNKFDQLFLTNCDLTFFLTFRYGLFIISYLKNSFDQLWFDILFFGVTMGTLHNKLLKLIWPIVIWHFFDVPIWTLHNKLFKKLIWPIVIWHFFDVPIWTLHNKLFKKLIWPIVIWHFVFRRYNGNSS